MWQTEKSLTLVVNDVKLEGRCWGPDPTLAPTLVLMHEGLGCVEMWKDFPQTLADRTGWGVFAYSRQGYGASDPAVLPRPIDYMTREAVDVLPHVLDQIGVQKATLIGHSDGATIAAIYAGSVKDTRLRGLCLLAPHFFAERSGLNAIKAANKAYADTDLKDRLSKYHRDVDNAFQGWAGAWLDPEFQYWNVENTIAGIKVPVLAIQGIQDQYGTMAQLDALSGALHTELTRTELPDCRHSPHLERPTATVDAIVSFLKS